MPETGHNRESKDHMGDHKLEAGNGNIPLQQPSSPGPGILTVKLGWAYHLRLPDNLDNLDNLNPEASKPWRLYAIGEYEKFQISTEATASIAAKGAVSWGAWQQPFKFEVSASSSSELELSIFARNSNFDASMLVSSWGDYESQVIFLGMVRLNPFQIGPGLHKMGIQNGIGRLDVELFYTRKEAPLLETSEVWSVRKENNSVNPNLTYVEKKDTGQSYGMKAIDIRTVHNDLPASGLSDIDTKIDINMAPRLSLRCAIQHPFIAPLKFAFRSPEGTLNLLSPLASGGYLFDHLQIERQFDINKARYYAAELVCTLEYLHNENIIPVSLEPDNILLDSSGHVSLCEPGIFGLKLGAGRNCIYPSTTNYPAPEALLDDQEISGALDWWALGTILYEMLMGIPPFYHKDSGERHNQILNQVLQLPENLPLIVRDILTKLLNKDSTQRLGANGAAEVKAHPFFQSVNWHECIQRKYATPFKPHDAASVLWREPYTYQPSKRPVRERREHQGEMYENISNTEVPFWAPIGSVNDKSKGDRSADKKTSVLADSEDDDGWELIWDPTDQEFYFKNHSTGERRTAKPKVAVRGRRYLPEVEHPTERQKEEALAAALQAGYSKQVVSQILRHSMNLNVQILEYDQTPDDIEIIRHGWGMVPVTPLEWAVEHERLDLVKLFLDNGADANFTVSPADGPALFKAVKRKSQRLVEILVQKTSRISCIRALALAVEQQDITTTTILLAHDNVRCDFEELDRPLPPNCHAWSCDLSDSAHIKNLEAKDLTPPLVRAARLGSVALIKLLLEHGADPNVAYHDLGGRQYDGYGYDTGDSKFPASFSCGRVIEIAMEMGYSEVIQLLLNAGADISLKHAVWSEPFLQSIPGHICLPVPRAVYVEVRAGLEAAVAVRPPDLSTKSYSVMHCR